MAYLSHFWQTATPPDHPVLARLNEFASFYTAIKQSGIVLKESGKKSRMVFGFQRNETVAYENCEVTEERFQYIPGLCRVLERLYFVTKEPPPMQPKFRAFASGPSDGKKRKKRPRTEDGAFTTPKATDVLGGQIGGHLSNSCLAKKKVHGSIVHRQIQDLVERFIKGLQDRREDAYFIRETERQDSYWDPCTLQFVTYLTENGLLPLATECIVFDPMCQIATSIDLVALDTVHLELVFLELKSSTSARDFEETDAARMRADPFRSVADSKLHRACLQSIATKLLAKRSPVPLVPDRCLVVHVSPHKTKATAYELPAWYIDNQTTIDAELYEALVRDQQERVHSKPDCLPEPETKAKPKPNGQKKRRRTKDEVA
jgi:hypothetical protein